MTRLGAAKRLNPTIHPRLDPEVRARLAHYCHQEQRTISNAVNLILDRGLPADTDNGRRPTERTEEP